jgi:hypothetical protein
VVVFTQYDRLVRTKLAELQDDLRPERAKDSAYLRAQSVEEARKSYDKCLQSLKFAMSRLKIPMPPYVTVSGEF